MSLVGNLAGQYAEGGILGNLWAPFQGYLPGPPQEPNLMAQYHKIEAIGTIGSTILAILEVQVVLKLDRSETLVRRRTFRSRALRPTLTNPSLGIVPTLAA